MIESLGTRVLLALHDSVEPAYVWAMSMVLPVGYAMWRIRRSELDSRELYWACVTAVLLGVWGSHLLGLLVYPSEPGLLSWLRIWRGGKSWFGGLIGGGLGFWLYLRLRRLPSLQYADAIAPAVALGYTVGRLGCFINGDDFGVQTQSLVGVQFPRGTEAYYFHMAQGLIPSTEPLSLSVHPVQLYHSLFGLLMFAILSFLPTRQPGRRLAALLIGYSVGRIALEELRGDFQPLVLGLSIQQVISLLLIGITLVVLAIGAARKIPPPPRPADAM